MLTATVLQQEATLIQQWVGIIFHACYVERRSNHNQDHFGAQNVKQKQTCLSQD